MSFEAARLGLGCVLLNCPFCSKSFTKTFESLKFVSDGNSFFRRVRTDVIRCNFCRKFLPSDYGNLNGEVLEGVL